MSDKIELIVIHRVKSMGPGLIGIQYGDEDFEKAQSFVSLDAGDATGKATTLPLKFKGSKLKGFGLADCDTITADSTAHQVT